MSKVVENLNLRTRLENLYESLTDNNGSSKALVEGYINQLDLRSDFSILRDACLEMKQYDWLSPVNNFIEESYAYVYENEVSFGLLNTLESLRTNRDSKSFASAINQLEELKDLSESDLRKRLPNKMKKHSWVPGVKNLISLTETLKGATKSTDDRFSNSRPVSPILENENGETLFHVGKRVYAMNEAEELRVAQANEITPTFNSLIALSENFTFTEDGLRLKSRNKIVDVKVNEGEVKVECDGKEINTNHLSAALMSTGKFRTDEYSTIRVLEQAVAQAKDLYELDFVDTISSNVYEGVQVNVLKTANGVYINKINPSMNENTLIKPDTAKDAVDLVSEFVDYDITNSVSDLLEGEAKIEADKITAEHDVYERIDYIKNEISKLSELEMDDMTEIQEAKKILSAALLKEQDRLNKMFKSKNVEIHEDSSDADYVPAELKIKIGTYKPGTKVQVAAGSYTEGGTKDMIPTILPSNEIVDVQKKYLSVEI